MSAVPGAAGDAADGARPSAASDRRSHAERGAVPIFAYGLPMVAVGFMWGLLTLYFLKYATDVLLIAPAAMGLWFGLSRLWDGVTDPLVGVWSDRTRTRWGRRRPWLLASLLPSGLAFYGLWSPPLALEGTALTVWCGLCLFALFTALTIFNIPYKALGAELDPDHHSRTRVFAAASFAENVGTVLAAAALGWLEATDEPRAVARVVAAAGSLAMAVLVIASVMRIREPVAHHGRGGSGAPLRSLAAVARNPHARVLLGVFFLEFLGQTTFTTALPYAAEYALDTPGATAEYLGAALISTLLTIPLWPRLQRRVGKVWLWRASLVAKVFAFAVISTLGEGDRAIVLALCLVFGAAMGCSMTIAPSVKADVVDSDEAETGERREGLFFATWNLCLKAAIGLALAGSGVALSVSGFVPNTAQSESALLGIRTLVGFAPLVLHAVAWWWLGRFRLDEDEHARVVHAVRSARSANA